MKCNGKHNRNAIVLAKILVWPNAVRSWPHEHLCCYTNLTRSVLIELKCVATGRLRLDWSDWAPIARLQSVEEGKTIDESTNREPWTDIDILIKTRSVLTGSGGRPRFLGYLTEAGPTRPDLTMFENRPDPGPDKYRSVPGRIPVLTRSEAIIARNGQCIQMAVGKMHRFIRIHQHGQNPNKFSSSRLVVDRYCWYQCINLSHQPSIHQITSTKPPSLYAIGAIGHAVHRHLYDDWNPRSFFSSRDWGCRWGI